MISLVLDSDTTQQFTPTFINLVQTEKLCI